MNDTTGQLSDFDTVPVIDFTGMSGDAAAKKAVAAE